MSLHSDLVISPHFWIAYSPSDTRGRCLIFHIVCLGTKTGMNDVHRGSIEGSKSLSYYRLIPVQQRHNTGHVSQLLKFSPFSDRGGSAASLLKSPFFPLHDPLAHKWSKKAEDSRTVGESGPLYSFARLGKELKTLLWSAAITLFEKWSCSHTVFLLVPVECVPICVHTVDRWLLIMHVFIHF